MAKWAAGVVGLAAVAGIFALMTSSEQAPAQQRPSKVVPQSREVVQQSFAPIVRKAAPAVVNVYVSSRVRTFSSPFARDPFFRRFFGEDDQLGLGRPTERMQSSLGSGVIVSADGVVVTNAHVVKARGETEIRVALADQRELDAHIVSMDEKSDIAVLKIEAAGESFPFMEFEDSDSLEVGDLVLAIGNPFGVGQTVTSGIVSALARSQIKSDAVFIQTDAAINPGNSGGALVDVAGRLVGINTAIFSRSGGSHGIGFAIPSNLVRLYVDSALSGRKVEKPWLGARLETVTRELAEALDLDRVSGVVVTRIYDGGPAASSGLQPGDVITRVDSFDVLDERSVNYRLTTKGVGNTAELGVIRKGTPQTVRVKLSGPPPPKATDFRNLSGSHPLDGARVAHILPVIAEQLELENYPAGVVVITVQRGSIAARLGFRPGDIISNIGGGAIATLADLDTALRDRQRVWQMTVIRGGQTLELRVPG